MDTLASNRYLKSKVMHIHTRNGHKLNTSGTEVSYFLDFYTEFLEETESKTTSVQYRSERSSQKNTLELISITL